MQLLVVVGMAGRACYPKDIPLDVPSWNGMHVGLFAVNAVAILLCAIAGGVSWNSWRRTREERAGSADRLLASGDGRTRFLALTGFVTSLLFGLAVVFEAINAFVITAC